MRAANSLHVILMVRRRSEEAAERALTATTQEVLRWKAHSEKLRCGLAEISASRAREIQCVTMAADHQSSEALYRALLQQCAEAERNIARLETIRAERMAAYMQARRAREVAEKLEEQSSMAHQAELALREQKWNEDLFLARRVSNSNRTMGAEALFESKESA